MSYESPQCYQDRESPPKIERQKNLDSLSQGISPKKLDFATMDYENKQELLNQCLKPLGDCQCCYKHHQVGNPGFKQPWSIAVYNYKYMDSECTCACRHMARFIDRKFNESDRQVGFSRLHKNTAISEI